MLWIPTQIPQAKVGYQTRIASLGVKMLRCCLYQTSLGMKNKKSARHATRGAVHLGHVAVQLLRLSGRLLLELQHRLRASPTHSDGFAGGVKYGCGSKLMGSHVGVDEFTTHFRTYFSGDWDVHWGYGVLTDGRM